MTELLEALLQEFVPDDVQYGGGYLRLSASGDKARKLAFDLQQYPKAEPQARTIITFAIGDLVHDYIRDHLENSERFDVLDRELTVKSYVYDAEGNRVAWLNAEGEAVDSVEGHVDLRLRDNETGKIYLVDIKTKNHVGYIYDDPKNKSKKTGKPHRYHQARNYLFDTFDRWADNDFSVKYLSQLASYSDAEPSDPDYEDEFIFDEAFFLTIDKATGHMAIGTYEAGEEEIADFLNERDMNFVEALEAESPYDLDVCYDEVEVGKEVPTVCGYCDFRFVCLDLRGTPPKWKVADIYFSPPDDVAALVKE